MALWKNLNRGTQIAIGTGIVLALVVLGYQLLRGPAQPASVEPITATLSEIFGAVFSRPGAEDEFSEAEESSVLAVGSQVKTLEDGRARLDLSNGTIIRLSSLTLFTLESQEARAEGLFTRFKLEAGKVWVILSGGSVEVDTPSGVASVRGSYMSVEYDPESGGVFITCLEGSCTLSNGGGTVTLIAGQTAYAANFDTPPVVGEMDDEDVQDWLDHNPEATLVVHPPTGTVEATVTPSSTPTKTATPTATATATTTSTATNDNWGGSGAGTVP